MDDGAKIGVGTACNPGSKVWFTLANGIVTEVYYPRLDTANTRDLQFLITDGKSFFHEEQQGKAIGTALRSSTRSSSTLTSRSASSFSSSLRSSTRS